MSFDAVYIIYNPNSTGDSVSNAKQLKSELLQASPKLAVTLQKTKYAGHAEDLAYDLSSKSKRPLIVSSSGDGGYNEVINGAIRAQLEGANPTCCVLPSGNANDHSRTLQAGALVKHIATGKVTDIDLLKISINIDGGVQEKYAHSYIGLGLTPVVAVELNKTDLNALKELSIVLKTFYKYRPFKILHKDKILKLDSIIFANIGEMAKVLTISKQWKPDDGLFEIVTFKHGHKMRLLRKLFRATVDGLETTKQTQRFEFKTLKKMPAQLDGEVLMISSGSTVLISSEKQLLKTVV